MEGNIAHKMPTISIITVALNAAETLSDCLDSVIRQGMDVEHIFVDGGSTDHTSQIVEKYRGSLSTVVSEPDHGIYDAMNKGVSLASGEIVGILNADDFYPSSGILRQVAEVFSDPDVDACYGDLCYLDAQKPSRVVRHWRAGEYASGKFYWGWMPPHPTFFVRRCFYEKYGAYNTTLGSAADYEIMLRFLLKHHLRVRYIPQELVHMHTGGISNATLSNRLTANRMDRKAWEVNGLKAYPWTLWVKPLRKIVQWF